MGNPYESQSISGYNSSPPPDDGSNTTANEITWAKHKTKIGDPLKTAIEAVDAATAAAFAKIFGANITATGTSYTVQSSDQGKLIRVTGSATITTPTAATEGAPFVFAVRNEHSSAITIDGAGSENVDGSANISLPAGQAIILTTDGSDWYSMGGYVETGPDAAQVYVNAQDYTSVASAATTNIGAASSKRVQITGTTTITAFDTVAAGLERYVRFSGSLTLTHSGALSLPGAANITTAAGDTAKFVSLGSGNWKCEWYTRADGAAISTNPGLTLLASASPSAASSVDITSAISATYKTYLLVFENLIPATDGAGLWLRTSTDNGSTFDSGASDYAFAYSSVDQTATVADAGSDASAQINLSKPSNVGSASDEGISGRVWISDPSDTAIKTRLNYESVYIDDSLATPRLVFLTGGGMRNSAADVDAIQLLFSTGNITSGEVRLYGVVES